ncbi:hypothetical protein BX666DRAFT_895152 [Dichotomocladium elegans]|nr:hypothetical protein BX666DRAFT_895152 [Dichotomocladium elegans]
MITDGTSSMKGWLRIRKAEKKPSIQVAPNALEQGKCYLIQASTGAHIALYQGFEEDLYAFSVQRYLSGTIRWLDARYLETDFCAFVAFDDRNNPLVDFWYKLGASVGQRLPMEWFAMFEDASRLERRHPDNGVSQADHRYQRRKSRRPVFFADRRDSISQLSLPDQTPRTASPAREDNMSRTDEIAGTDQELEEDKPVTATEATEATTAATTTATIASISETEELSQ